jgi:hypothetical protein
MPVITTVRAPRYYVDPSRIDRGHPLVISPLLRSAATAVERSDAAPAAVEDPASADFFVLPMVWSYYLWHGRMEQARAMAREAAGHGKLLLVWHTGDLDPVLPFDNVMLFHAGPERSRQRPHHFAAPAFIEDPLPRHAGRHVTLRQWQSRPVVGFCGYASTNIGKLVYSMALNVRTDLTYRLGRSAFRPAPLVPASVLRARVLRQLAKSRQIDTRFIVRDRYRAGLRRPDAADPTARDFFRNVLDTDYTVCVRGYGNWSQRFYEVLACGRIPIVIDTDLVLPFDFAIDWRKYCVWVPRADVARVAELVGAFHDARRGDDFAALQLDCRRVWEERLTLDGFLNHFSEHVHAG